MKFFGKPLANKVEQPVKAAEPVNPNEADPALELCYVDIKGNRYFKWKQPATMHSLRYLVGWSDIEYANMGHTPAIAIEYLDQIIQANNAGNPSGVGYHATAFKNRIIKASPEAAYLEMAAVYILIGDENKEVYEPNITARKINLWKSDLKAKAFFLNYAFQLTKILQSTSEEGILSALTTQGNELIKVASTTLRKLYSEDSTT